MSDAALAQPGSGRGWFRGSLAWRLVLPIPLTLVIAVVAIWMIVPRLITANAVERGFMRFGLNFRQTADQGTSMALSIRTY